jgi:hypothetical protein
MRIVNKSETGVIATARALQIMEVSHPILASDLALQNNPKQAP